jgi:hypothetical protein
MEKYYIYKLTDPLTDQVRYIGKTNNIAKRFSSHLNDKSKSHKASWITSLKNKGLLPTVEILEEFDCEQQCYLKEVEYIQQYDNLTNHQLGGIGGCSESTRGCNNPNSNLNEDQVLEIKDILSYTELSIKNIALKFNVSIATIHGITSGNAWGYLTGFTGKEKWTRGESIKNRVKSLKEKGVYDKQSIMVLQYNLDDVLIKEFKSISEASRLTNTNRSSLSQCINGKLKTANNFKWRKHGTNKTQK